MENSNDLFGGEQMPGEQPEVPKKSKLGLIIGVVVAVAAIGGVFYFSSGTGLFGGNMFINTGDSSEYEGGKGSGPAAYEFVTEPTCTDAGYFWNWNTMICYSTQEEMDAVDMMVPVGDYYGMPPADMPNPFGDGNGMPPAEYGDPFGYNYYNPASQFITEPTCTDAGYFWNWNTMICYQTAAELEAANGGMPNVPNPFDDGYGMPPANYANPFDDGYEQGYQAGYEAAKAEIGGNLPMEPVKLSACGNAYPSKFLDGDVGLSAGSPTGSRVISSSDKVFVFDIFAPWSSTVKVQNLVFCLVSEEDFNLGASNFAMLWEGGAIVEGAKVNVIDSSHALIEFEYEMDSEYPQIEVSKGASKQFTLVVNSSELISADAGVDDNVIVYLDGINNSDVSLAGNTLKY